MKFLIKVYLYALIISLSACASTEVTTLTETASLPPSEAASAAPTNAAPVGASNPRTFVLVDGSLVRFKVDEILNGSPTTVIGESVSVGAVEGSISLDYASPAAVTLSPVKIDLSSLATDNSFRNRSLHDLILQTGTEVNRYAQFNATAFSNLPESAQIGQTYAFQITGDLTIHGVTKPVTFEAQVTPISETRLEGSATVIVQYEDFGIQILRLPQQVAAVYKDVILEIVFIAEAQ